VPVREPFAAVFGLAEGAPLDHRAHGAVEHEHARGQQPRQGGRGVRAMLGSGRRHRWPPGTGGALE